MRHTYAPNKVNSYADRAWTRNALYEPGDKSRAKVGLWVGTLEVIVRGYLSKSLDNVQETR